MNIETHPHAAFIPPNLKVLIIGSFPGRAKTLTTDTGNNWFYAATRNQFWKIMEGVFQKKLATTKEKQLLFSKMGIGITDIIAKARRKADSNMDQDLEIIAYNDKVIAQILKEYPGIPILFTSRFVEKHFKKLFPCIENTCCLPSPSPRYAKLSLAEKTARYRELIIRKP